MSYFGYMCITSLLLACFIFASCAKDYPRLVKERVEQYRKEGKWILSFSKNATKEEHFIVYADEPSYDALLGKYPEQLLMRADASSFGTEFLDYKISVKCVENMDEALAHISRYSSKHSEVIITEDASAAERFSKEVDAACVYTNVSTAFTDGGQFGFGAEIGISTQKLHARGPMALNEITSYKYLIHGDGQTRDDNSVQKCCL